MTTLTVVVYTNPVVSRSVRKVYQTVVETYDHVKKHSVFNGEARLCL